MLFEVGGRVNWDFGIFELFNWLLLGKQVWRLLNDERSLVHKAKYFSNSTFMESGLRNILIILGEDFGRLCEW